jgi:hypothetical protein
MQERKNPTQEEIELMKSLLSKFTSEDIENLRQIEPKKSVLNFSQQEVDNTKKFAEVMNTELEFKSPYERRTYDWRESDTQKVPVIEVGDIPDLTVGKVLEDMKSRVIPRGKFVNKDTDFVIEVARDGISGTISHLSMDAKRHKDIRPELNALYHIDALVKNSVSLDTQTTDNKVHKSPNSLFMHKLYSPFNFQDKPYIAKITVEDFYSTDKNLNVDGLHKRFYNLKDIKVKPLNENSLSGYNPDKVGFHAQKWSGSTINISQLYNCVKSFDKDFYTNANSPGRTAREDEIKKSVAHYQNMLQEGVKDVISSGRYQEYLDTMSKFHNYSARNVALILLQNPNATQCAGFGTWKTLDRYVTKGQKGLSILAPNIVKEDVVKVGEDGNPVLDDKGNYVLEKGEERVKGYRLETVYDVSQTDGKPLPEMAKRLTENVPLYNEQLKILKAVSPVPVRFEDIQGANGYFDKMNKEIVIKNGMSEAQRIKTLTHEITHAVLHDPDNGSQSMADKQYSHFIFH